MSRYEACVLAFGAPWADALWTRLRELSWDELAPALPRYVPRVRGDGLVDVIDEASACRAALLTRLVEPVASGEVTP